jgi:hypothetical protein
MKEWLTVKPDAAARWVTLAREAMAFVAEGNAKPKPRGKKPAKSA